MKEDSHNQIMSLLASLTDAQRLDVPNLHSRWHPWLPYEAGDIVNHNGILYRCLQAHTSEDAWSPPQAPSLWAKLLISDPAAVPEWEQPESTNPYMAGDKVTHNGKTWVSDIDNNVWEPGVYGWTETACPTD